MDDYHWQEIAEKFIELYPDSEFPLIDVALEHFGEDGTILEGYRSHALSVVNKIAENINRRMERVKNTLVHPSTREHIT